MEEEYKFYKETNSYKWGKRIYEISNLGNVKINGKLIKPRVNNSGYYIICHKVLHKIIAELFIPNPYNKPYVDHINTIKTDNRIENLKWVTQKENCNNPLTRKNMSKSKIGISKHPLSEETKRKISERNKGKIMSKEHKLIVSKTHKGKKLSEETKKKMLESKRKNGNWPSGEKNGMYGYIWTEEQRKNIIEKLKGKHRVYDNPEHTKWHME